MTKSFSNSKNFSNNNFLQLFYKKINFSIFFYNLKPSNYVFNFLIFLCPDKLFKLTRLLFALYQVNFHQ